MSQLFSTWTLGNLRLPNRIVIAPMCQYSAHDGSATDWHLIHLGHLALSGAGLLILEATAVAAQGRITPGCLGLYSDPNETALARVLDALRKHSPIALAIQLAHAGRKGSSHAPWDGGKQIRRDEALAWETVSASDLPHAEGEDPPAALDLDGLKRIRNQFVDAARRAARLGLAGVELHGAHGYLLHQFLSPIANRRIDAYGGSLQNRMRFPLEVFDAVREAFPADRPVWMRLSATDWVSDGWDVESTLEMSRALQARGCAAIHVSTGGVAAAQSIKPAPGFQVPFAAQVKAAIGLPTICVGLITEPEQAEAIVAGGQADAVALARAMLSNPRWPWHAAEKLGAKVQAPSQYWRAARDPKALFEGLRHGMR